MSSACEVNDQMLTGCDKRHRGIWRIVSVVLLMLSFLIVLVVLAIKSSWAASEAASEMKSNLSVHEARQNGSLEKIDTQLDTLRGYHSTLRGDVKDLTAELKEQRDFLMQRLPPNSSSTP